MRKFPLLCGVSFAALLLSTSLYATKIQTKAEKEEEAQKKETVIDRSTNISVNVPGGAAAEFKISDAMTLGIFADFGGGGFAFGGGGGRRGSGSSTKDVTKTSSTSFGILSHYKLTGTTFGDGFFISPRVSYVSASLKDSDTGYKSTGSGFGAAVIGGYGWFWHNGFNIQIGLGVQYTKANFKNLDFTDTDGTPDQLNANRINGTRADEEAAFGFAF